MKPGFEENFIIHNLLQEQGASTSVSKIPAIADNYNQRAMLYDTNFDVASIVLAASSGFITIGSALYFNTSFPLYLFALVLLIIFIGSMALRLDRENFIKSLSNEKNEIKDKVQMVAQHNTAFIKNKLFWLSFITFFTLSIIGICAVVVTEIELKWPLLIVSPILALLISIIIYFKDWSHVNKLLSSLNKEIENELIKGINSHNVG
jgi:Na+/melibiose symporter-like transporter